MTVDSIQIHGAADTIGRRHPYGSWVEDHGNAALSSNVGSADLAFQRWFRFKEAYSPRVVAEVLDGIGLPVSRVIDPTGGGRHDRPDMLVPRHRLRHGRGQPVPRGRHRV